MLYPFYILYQYKTAPQVMLCPTYCNYLFTGGHGPLTVEKLTEMYGMTSDQLDCEIEEEDMIILAGYFDNIEFYLDKLRLTAAEQADVKFKKVTEGSQIAMNYCLSLWKRHNPSTATLKKLLEILLSLRKEEIASKVCNYYYPKHK